LLGIPIPPIFVFQRVDGVWDVIDGLQRMSTILEFAGELKDEAGHKLPPIQLAKTRYLPSLAEKYWENEDEAVSFTDAQRRLIKRAKLDVKIIKNDTSQTSKYELFDRLNTGGSIASDQEVRDCLLIMADRPLYQWLKNLADDPNFVACTPLTSRQLEEKYNLELVLRFLVFKDIPNRDLHFEEVGDFLTERMLKFASQEVPLDREASAAAFRRTFAVLNESGLADDAFRKYDEGKGKFLGSFSISGYEAISLGLGARFTVDSNAPPPANLTDIVKGLWTNATYLGSSGSGVRASQRIPRIVPLGRELLGGA